MPSARRADKSVPRRRLALAALGVIGAGALATLGVIGLAGGEETERRGAPAAAELAARANVVVIMTDDQTLSAMSVMPKTRRLIGGAGIDFERSYVTDPLCCPSRATFQTGQYAHNHGVISNGGPNALPALRRRDTIGVWMRRAGYRTGFVGKYFNGYDEKRATRVPPGWDEWYALVDPTSQNYVEYELSENGELVHYGPDPAEYKTTVLGEKAIGVIRAAAGRRRPFFLYVGFNAPHAPATPAPEDSGALAGLEAPRTPNFNEEDLSDKPSFLSEREPADGLPARVAASQQEVLESLLAVDRQVRAIVRALKKAGELEDTYVVFTSDNGYFAGEHRIEYGKLLPYEESSRVPLLIRGPGIPAGSSSEALVGNIDLAPTITEIAGAEPTLDYDGRSLLPLRDRPSPRGRGRARAGDRVAGRRQVGVLRGALLGVARRALPVRGVRDRRAGALRPRARSLPTREPRRPTRLRGGRGGARGGARGAPRLRRRSLWRAAPAAARSRLIASIAAR